MRLNNKGFAISSILYIILVLAITLIILSLTVLSSRSLVIDKLKNEAMDNIYNISYKDVIKKLKVDAINYGINNNIEKESIKIADLDLSVSNSLLEYYELSDKYLTLVSNKDAYDVYLGKLNTITDISKSVDIVDIIDYKIYGNSYQDTYTGKNLFDINKLNGGEITNYNGKKVYMYKDGDTNFTYVDYFEENRQYTLTLKAYRDESITNVISIYFHYTDGTSSYTDIVVGEKTSLTSKGGKTLESISGYNNWNKNVYLDLSIIQLEKGVTATAYEPYVGGVGAPNPSYPQEIKSVGNLITDSNDENYGKYELTIKSSTSTDNKKTTILLDNPLRSVGSYYDYIDYSDKKIVRNINEYIITGSESDKASTQWKYSGGYGKEIRSNALNSSQNVPMDLIAISNYYTYMNSKNSSLDHVRLVSNKDTYGYIAINDLNYQGEDTVDSFVLYLKGLYGSGVPVKIIYPVYPDRNTSDLELPKINIFEGKQTISIETSIKPSNVEFVVIEKIRQL